METYLKTTLEEYLGVTVREFVNNSRSFPSNPSYEDIVRTLCRRFSEKELTKYGIGEFIAPYFKAKRDQLQARIVPCLLEAIQENYPWLKPGEDGTYVEEMFADYDQQLYPSAIQGFLAKSDPKQAFAEHLDWMYQENKAEEEYKLVQKISEQLYDPDLDDDVAAMVEEALSETFFLVPPADHFLKQEVRVSIHMDTGTGHRGFYECRRDNGELDEKSGILWLVKQQGYSEDEFRTALRQDEYAGPTFLVSAKQELENTTYDDNLLTFLVRMTVGQLLDLAAAVKLQERDGKFNDTTLIPDCGTITLGSNTNCGLYNPWNGSGGPIDIELEQDVVLPIRFIHELVVEYNSHRVGGPYLMQEAFGLCGSAWKETVKAFNPITNKESE